jgi:transcriptional regulator of heat shock response
MKSNNQVPAELSQSRKYAIFFKILVQGFLKMQSFVKQFKALRSEMRGQRERVHGFVPSPPEVFEQYAKIFSNITEVELSEMKLFLKEYLKDHLRKKMKEQTLPQEKIEEVLYETHQKVITPEGIETVLNAKKDAYRSLEKIDRGNRKLFQSEESAKIHALVGIMENFFTEISGISGYSKDEISETQYAVLVAIVDGL